MVTFGLYNILNELLTSKVNGGHAKEAVPHLWK